MGLLGMQQKAEMTAQGFSPEQAEMAMGTPTPEIQQAQAYGEQEAEGVRRAHPVGQEDMAREQEQLAMSQMPPPEDPNEEKRFKRETDKAKLDDQLADRSHRREKEKMGLQDKVADKQHRRGLEATKYKSKADEAKTRQDIMRSKIAAKKAAQPPKKPKGKK